MARQLEDHNIMDSEKYFTAIQVLFFTCTGTHEVQECLEGQGEVDLDVYKKNCQKPHKGFLPVNKFSVEHFPSGYKDNDIFDLTKALAYLTVRIAVKLTSPDRPQFVRGTKDPYPCHDTRGKDILHTGTGRVREVINFTESKTPSKVWFKVDVETATHVVFDDSEAIQSSCRLWFDDDKSPKVKVHGLEVALSDTEQDWCTLYCVTHDVYVVDKMEEMVGHFKLLRDKVWDKYKSRRDKDKIIIIVSHPHGCSKQVSVGHWVHRQVVGVNDWTRYTYTTCTCPGSSGATVYRLGYSRRSNHPHSGVKSEGLNYSGLCFD